MLSAAFNGRADEILALLDRGADLDYMDWLSLCTPLIKAAWAGHAECVRLLVECGADKEAKNKVR